MPSQRPKTRRCSSCNAEGHNKTTCPQGQKESMQKKKSVFIRVVPNRDITSPHVVNLAGDKDTKLPVYTHRAPSKKKRVTLNLSQVIRTAKKRPTFAIPKREKLRVKNEKLNPGVRERRDKNKNIKVAAVPVKTTVTKKKVSSKKKKTQTKRAWGNIRGYAWQQFALGVAMIGLLIALPFPAIAYYKNIEDYGQKILNASQHGFFSLQSSTVAAFQSDTDTAKIALADALSAFSEATTLLEEQHVILRSVTSILPIIGPQVQSRQSVLQAGHQIALGNSYMIKGIQDAQNDELLPSQKLQLLRQYIRAATPQYEQALHNLSAVPAAHLPANYQQPFEEFRLLFAAMVEDLQDIVSLAQALESVVGNEGFQRYLVVFQNNHELRATGGFVGSFAICDVQRGKFLGCDIPPGGSYDLKGQLSEHVVPPEPLQLVNKRWEFQDANWWPEFSASAEKLAWFYEASRNTTVDGVIAINASVLPRLLSILGPITNTEHNVVLQVDTALNTLQHKVEVDYDKEKNTPKQIIADVADQFVSLTDQLDTVDLIRVLTQMHAAAEEKEIQVYFRDEKVQQTFGAFGWTGELFNTAVGQDYLMVVTSNLQGQKSDARVVQDIEHQAEIQEDGSIIVTTAIHRHHTGRPGEQFYGGLNTSYLRAYVPEGAILLEAGGFEYPPESAFHVPESWYDEDTHLAEVEVVDGVHAETGTRVTRAFGKTVFGNWIMVPPGEQRTVYFVYELPFGVGMYHPPQKYESWLIENIAPQASDAMRYSFVVQKQSGSDTEIRSQVIFPDGWTPVWTSGEHIDIATNGIAIHTPLDTDYIFGVVAQQ